MDGGKKGSLRAAGLEQGLDPERFKGRTDRIWRLTGRGSEEGEEITV